MTSADEARWSSKRPVQVTIISGSQSDGQASTATVRSVLDSLSGDRAALVALEDQQLEPETARREQGVTRRQLAAPVSAMQVIGGEALSRS